MSASVPLPKKVGEWLRVMVASDDNREGEWIFSVTPYVKGKRIRLRECDGYVREPVRAIAEEILADLLKRPHAIMRGSS